MDINCITLQGRLTKGAIVERTRSGGWALKFTIACNRAPSGDENKADFVNCVMYGDRGEKISTYMAKGRQVILTGRLQVDTWQKNGNWETYVCVIVNQLSMIWTEIDKKIKEENQAAAAEAKKSNTTLTDDYYDSVPF